MKNIIVIGSVLAVIGLLVALTIPAIAHELGNGTSNSTNTHIWEDMYDACQNGDWEAMEEAARQVHSDDYDSMPYHEGYNGTPNENGKTYDEHWNETDNHMGGGMMGGGWSSMTGGGMMGW